MNKPVYEYTWYRMLAWSAVLLYMAVIFVLSSQKSVPLPTWFPYQDKLYHFIEYHLLGFLLAHATMKGTQKRRFWFAFALASVYGLSDEFHQYFVPGRDCSFGDWLADTVGAWSGAYLYLKSENILRKSRTK